MEVKKLVIGIIVVCIGDMYMDMLNVIKQNKIVAVIRNADAKNIVPILIALHKGGINVVEITAETPKVASVIEKAVKQIGKKVTIGAGTVIDPETANLVIKAGAQFIVSPTLNIETVKLANRYGVLNIPGVLTPTEMITAYEHGARAVKIFPADSLGSEYIGNVLGPLPFVQAMVTGGITLENMNTYLAKGSIAVGIGSNLVNTSTLHTSEDYEKLTARAKQYVASLHRIKQT